MQLLQAREVAALAHGDPVIFAGLVICRQRPGTAAPITFMTLEDESGFVNLVVHPKVFEQFALVAKTQNFLGVTGHARRQDNVTRVIASSLSVPRLRALPADVESRDLHCTEPGMGSRLCVACRSANEDHADPAGPFLPVVSARS